jgi:2'-5' RNA ligase
VRLFVSVEPSDDARSALAGRLAELDLTPARPVPAERWHITLAFLGEVADGRVTALRDELATVARAAGWFPLRLSAAGTFPARGCPSALWIGLAGDLPELRRLAANVGTAVRRCGVRLERRPFAPHLTVARYRVAPPGAADAALAMLSPYDGPPFEVGELQLVRSHLGPHPRHEPVAGWPLAADRRPGDQR